MLEQLVVMEKYSTPEIEIMQIASNSVVCASNGLTTEDFEFGGDFDWGN